MNIAQTIKHTKDLSDLEPLMRPVDYDICKEVRNALYLEMRSQGLNQHRLGIRSGMVQSNVSNFMRGERVPTLDVLQRIAHGLGKRLVIRLEDEH